MKVNLNISSFFRKWLTKDGAEFSKEKDGDKLELEVELGTTVNDLFKIIGIPDQVDRSFFVNRRHADLDTQLNEGDTLLVLPLLGGG
jgi:molybdopterin converting factor small subunit